MSAYLQSQVKRQRMSSPLVLYPIYTESVSHMTTNHSENHKSKKSFSPGVCLGAQFPPPSVSYLHSPHTSSLSFNHPSFSRYLSGSRLGATCPLWFLGESREEIIETEQTIYLAGLTTFLFYRDLCPFEAV